jgi:uncharacterized protein with GYD domain
MNMMIIWRFVVPSLLISPCRSFFVGPLPRGFGVTRPVTPFTLYSSSSSSTTTTTTSNESTNSINDIESMRAGEIKKELESYGISTKSFLEKKELVEALQKARLEGLKPKMTAETPQTGTSTSSTTTTTEPVSAKSREDRLQDEMVKCQSMKAGEIKKELESRGISTKSFFEKSEFVKALAEAIVDGVDKTTTTTKSSAVNGDGEGYAEYTDVEVLTSDDAGPRKKQSQQQPPKQQQSPFGGAGGNPFGGGTGGGMPGGMGGMGGIADMLKNMGMGGGGGNPFGGAGGNPFGGAGDVMGQAQKMMQNPKVRELMMRAQSNPKMMQAMQECMSNPAAFAKYQNDPEVSAFLKELQNIM